MTQFLPIFPLGIVVFPNEGLNLHIFEPRYIQLINDCVRMQKPFGIPTVMNGKVQERGALMQITDLSQGFDADRQMGENGGDIRTESLGTFRVLEVVKSVPDKLYQGAIVHIDPRESTDLPSLPPLLLTAIRQLHGLLNIEKKFPFPDSELRSFDVAHHLGFSLEEEYQLRELMEERQRQEFIRRHLGRVVPTLQAMEQLKERARLNGHFRPLPGHSIE
ncbi:MAG: peptidase S16 [Bacteroidetes bacterium]|nr:peptidase S16 [Bacteroidota bacterium]